MVISPRVERHQVGAAAIGERQFGHHGAAKRAQIAAGSARDIKRRSVPSRRAEDMAGRGGFRPSLEAVIGR
jgi:hypothetical protein